MITLLRKLQCDGCGIESGLRLAKHDENNCYICLDCFLEVEENERSASLDYVMNMQSSNEVSFTTDDIPW